MKFRLVVYVAALLATSLIVGMPSAAEGEEDDSSRVTANAPRFDPWGAPHHRWPDLHTSHLGQEKAYYHWSRKTESHSYLKQLRQGRSISGLVVTPSLEEPHWVSEN